MSYALSQRGYSHEKKIANFLFLLHRSCMSLCLSFDCLCIYPVSAPPVGQLAGFILRFMIDHPLEQLFIFHAAVRNGQADRDDFVIGAGNSDAVHFQK